jgi:pimeloyl-ACP methyl ester carboxylesterase
MWVAYHQPSDQATRDELKPLARLVDINGKEWIPDVDKLQHGCVVIVHGLYGDVESTLEISKRWPKQCGLKIQTAMGDKAPDVCVVDWRQAAQTAHYQRLNLGLGLSEHEDILTDLSGVRGQAEEVGDLLAFRLAMMILDKNHPTIRKDCPLHLIGHSAGGFVIARVAVLLKQFYAAPTSLHVTILDTPAPTAEMLTVLPSLYPDDAIDFYTSSLIGGLKQTFERANFPPTIHHHVVTPKSGAEQTNQGIVAQVKNIWSDHRFAFEWYIETIDEPTTAPNDGFNRSPLWKFNKLEPVRQ